MDISIFYITAPNHDEAIHIADKLVELKLAACVNILGNIDSVYIWEGRTVHDSEVSMIVKTTKENEEKLIDFVKSIHSYECPCIISIDVKNGNFDFLNWIQKSVER